jgi:hypothetical protein
MYHFPEPRRVFFKCKQQQEWTTTHMVLQDTGVLRNIDCCHVTTEGVQLYPLLDGETVFDSPAPSLYTPSLPEITSAEEIQLLRKLSDLAEGSALGIATSGDRLQYPVWWW